MGTFETPDFENKDEPMTANEAAYGSNRLNLPPEVLPPVIEIDLDAERMDGEGGYDRREN
jgi:hypothetical protein